MITLKRRLIKRRNHGERFLFQQHRREVVSTVAIRRKTIFFAFLAVICQYAAVDSINMLPAIIIFYSMGIALSLELISGETKLLDLTEDIDGRSQHARIMTDPEEVFRRTLGLAHFEFFVLKKRAETKFARIQDRDGNINLFAI